MDFSSEMPIEDPEKRAIAEKALLNYKICRHCGAKNPINATKCRRCHWTLLRPKKAKLKR